MITCRNKNGNSFWGETPKLIEVYTEPALGK